MKVTQNAYRNYLEEKKLYEKELEEETRLRLERLLSKQNKQESGQATSPSKRTSEEVKSVSSSTPNTNTSGPVQTKPAESENRAKWAYKRFVEITK